MIFCYTDRDDEAGGERHAQYGLRALRVREADVEAVSGGTGDGVQDTGDRGEADGVWGGRR